MPGCSCSPMVAGTVFDPANDAVQDARYVTVAVGRDYGDVPPIRGTFHGIASEEWETNVRMRSIGQQ